MAVNYYSPYKGMQEGINNAQQSSYNQTRNALAQTELDNAPGEMANRNKLLDLQVQGAQQGLDQGAANAKRGDEERLLNQALAQAQQIRANPGALSQMPRDMQQRAREQLGEGINDPQKLSEWGGNMAAAIQGRLGKPPAEQWTTETNPDGSTTQINNVTNERKLVQGRTPVRGNGITYTATDGSIVQIGGSGGGGGVGPQDLSGPTRNKLQESIVQATEGLDRLNRIGDSFDAKFLTVPGRLKGVALNAKSMAGGLFGDMSEDEKKYVTDFTTFRADAAKNLNLYIKEITGASMSVQEGSRIIKGAPDPENDGPEAFMAKYKSSIKDVSRAVMRANWSLKNGIGVKSVADLSKVMPLDAIDYVYAQRANAIWQELGGKPETKAQSVKQANQEFGLGR